MEKRINKFWNIGIWFSLTVKISNIGYKNTPQTIVFSTLFLIFTWFLLQ